VKSVEAERAGLGRSLFEKITATTASSSTPVAVMLEEQYRMNARIMAYPSAVFYHNRLKAAPAVAEWQLENIAPLLFIDTAGCGFTEKTESETGSTFNEEEAALLVRHFTELSETLSNAAQGVSAGIISPYKAQVKILAAQLKGLKRVLSTEVNTIDSFQGQERDIIYISLVRSNDEGQIGFLKDIRRMNVAMTRARKRLVIVGDSATVGSHPFYKSFIDKAMDWGTYQSAWELMY
jgi:superfamily I DNA and/or RNA helicase